MNHNLNKLLPLFALLVILTACATKTQNKNGVGIKEKLPSNDLSSKPFSTATRKTAFEDAGKFITVEGSACVQRDKGGGSANMLLFVDMPNYVDRGTVLLNGWDLRYLRGDHEVRQMRTDIIHSKLVTGDGPPTLAFEVEGELNDQDQDDDFEFCVHYTGIGFSSAWFDAKIEGDYGGIDSGALQNKNMGAVSSLESVWSDGNLKSRDSVAVIPRGFDFQHDNAFECEWRFLPCKWGDPTDHQLLQIAYNLFQTGVSPNPGGNLHWITQTIFKDNSIRAHWIKTRAALIGGSSIKLRTDFLPLIPRNGGEKICRNYRDGTVHTETIRLHDLPFDYAVPMLTGWNLSYECDDQHVQRAGIWIHDIRFDPNTNGLEFKISSILRDKDGAPSFNAAHGITVLGFNRLVAPNGQSLPEANHKLFPSQR